MNFYESQIIKLQKRIKTIEENPDATKLKSNKLRYEVQLEGVKEQLEGWRQGKPFSNGGDGMAGMLTRAMGFIYAGSVEPAFQTMEPQKYLEHARLRGLPVDSSCDMTMMPFAMMECGDLPMEDLAICDKHVCTPMMLRGIYVAHLSKTVSYYIDIGFEDNEVNLEHVTEQLQGFIEFAENQFPGVIKYDEDRLIELQAYHKAARDISDEVCQLLKCKPTPIAGKDMWGQMVRASSAKGLEYLRARRDEVAERVAKGMAAVPGEKLRILWTGVTNPIFMDPYKVLAKWKIATFRGVDTVRPVKPAYFGGRKLTPMEEVASEAMSNLTGRPGINLVNNIIQRCREFQRDAIINYNMRGCTAALGLRKLVEDAAEKELGIPTLQLEGAQWDTSYANEATITARLDEFAQMLLIRNGIQ